MLNDVVTDDIAQRIRVPTIAAQQSLLAPWARITGSLGAHPAGLATLLAQQAIKKQPGVHHRAMLGEQRPDPLLYVPQR
jgi:hypothetical protein